MGKTKKFYWIKLKTDFFDLPTIDWLLEQENGCEYVVLYQKLCLITANNGGELSRRIGEMIIPFEAKKIADITHFPIDTVVVGLKLYRQLGLIYEHENGFLRISQFDEMVGSETKWAEKKRLQRGKKGDNVPQLQEGHGGDNVLDSEGHSEDNVRQEIEIRDRDKRLEIRDQSLEKEKEGEEEPPDDERPGCPPHTAPAPYEQIRKLYNKICVSFPRCTAMSEARKKAIKARLASGYTPEDFKRIFEKTEASSFMKGANSRNWRASFDWLIKDSNMAKVLDGNYDDHVPEQGPAPMNPDGGPSMPQTNNPFAVFTSFGGGGQR